jgi:FkbM family methyltransferase
LHDALIQIAFEGPYEYKQVRLEKGDVVIDAGANIGEFSALAGVRGCTSYAFEPMQDIIDEYLSKTAEWNPNITICPYAISDKVDVLTFDVEPFNLVGATYVLPRTGAKKVQVQAIDLDTFVEQNNLPRVDFIKADIEGAERYMLMGARRVLKEFAPKIAICTYHLPDDPQVLRQLILDANPDYVIEERWKKMYAHVPKKS